MLADFFRINLPYGIAKNKNNQWMAFNREYMPLGFNDYKYKKQPGEDYLELPVYTDYNEIPESILLDLASENLTAIVRDKENNIIKVFLYDDASNPVNHKESNPLLWKQYVDKIEKLSKLIITV